jgi:hypothetical protein
VTSSQPDTDSLFQLPLAEFTSARNALASRLTKAGRRDAAALVKALTKPSISAWAANQVYWRHRVSFDRLMTSGEQVRRAQASQLAGRAVEMRAPIEARREALAELSRLAADALSASGHPPTPEMMRRVTTTLEALSAIGRAPDAPPAGRLTDDVDPPGFETLASLVPAFPPATRREGGRGAVLPFQAKAGKRRKESSKQEAEQQEAERRAQRKAAQAAAREAERHLHEARAAAARAESALKKAATRVKAAEAAKADAEQRLERAAAELDEARQAARKVAAEAEKAADAVADAERGLSALEKDL